MHVNTLDTITDRLIPEQIAALARDERPEAGSFVWSLGGNSYFEAIEEEDGERRYTYYAWMQWIHKVGLWEPRGLPSHRQATYQLLLSWVPVITLFAPIERSKKATVKEGADIWHSPSPLQERTRTEIGYALLADFNAQSEEPWPGSLQQWADVHRQSTIWGPMIRCYLDDPPTESASPRIWEPFIQSLEAQEART